MTNPREAFLSRTGLDEIAVERAVSEFRAGRSVVVSSAQGALLVCGVEAIDAALASDLDDLAEGRARLVLPAARLRRLGLDRNVPGAVALPVIDPVRIETLALRIEARVDAPVSPVAELDAAGLELARIALTLPAIVAFPVEPDALPEGLCVRVTAEAIRAYRRRQAQGIAGPAGLAWRTAM